MRNKKVSGKQGRLDGPKVHVRLSRQKEAGSTSMLNRPLLIDLV